MTPKDVKHLALEAAPAPVPNMGAFFLHLGRRVAAMMLLKRETTPEGRQDVLDYLTAHFPDEGEGDPLPNLTAWMQDYQTWYDGRRLSALEGDQQP